MQILRQAIVLFVAAVSLCIVAKAQSLADVARKTEEERAKAKQDQPAPAFTDKDLVAVPGPDAAASRGAGTAPARSASDATATPPPAGNPNRDQAGDLSSPQCQKASSSVHVSRVPGINGDAVETTLTLVLRGRKRDELPINLGLRAIHDDRSRSNTPRELSLRFTLNPQFAGTLDFKPPHVVFVIDDGQASAANVSATIGAPLVGVISSVAIEPFDLADLTRLEHATTLRGRLFNIEFTVTPEQVCAIREFSQRARQRVNRPGAVF